MSGQIWSHVLLVQYLVIATLFLKKKTKPSNNFSWVAAKQKTSVPTCTHCRSRFGHGEHADFLEDLIKQQDLDLAKQTLPFEEVLLNEPFSQEENNHQDSGFPSAGSNIFNCFLTWALSAAFSQWQKQMETLATWDNFVLKTLASFKEISKLLDLESFSLPLFPTQF